VASSAAQLRQAAPPRSPTQQQRADPVRSRALSSNTAVQKPRDRIPHVDDRRTARDGAPPPAPAHAPGLPSSSVSGSLPPAALPRHEWGETYVRKRVPGSVTAHSPDRAVKELGLDE
jgi:hypothetical protein